MKIYSVKSFLLLALIALVLGSCQHRQFGHLSKVRVKSDKQEKKMPVRAAQPENPADVCDELEPLVEASAGSSNTYVETGKESHKKPLFNARKAQLEKKHLSNPKREKKHSDEPEPDPARRPVSVPALLSLVFGLIITLSLFISLNNYSINFDYIYFGLLISSLVVLVLGIVGIVFAGSDKATNRLWTFFFGIILGAVLVILALVLLFFILWFSGGLK